ncbi:MAG: type II secretion system F family protein, partial [Marinobacter sp.]
MPAYEFKALDPRGKQKHGVVEADAARAVRQQLREKGLTPLSVEPAVEKQARSNPLSSRGSLSAADLALVTRQLATLIQSGIPIEQALSATAQQTAKPRIRGMLIAIRSKVMEGYTLADSFGEFPKAFPRLYRSTVAAGEHAGHLDLVLNRLADYTESRQEARQKIQLAAIYPIILSIVAISIVVFLLTYVVPDIIEVFLKQGQELPALTMAMLAVSDFLGDFGVYLLIVLVLGVIGFRIALTKPGFR